jgi:hypothetical protein
MRGLDWSTRETVVFTVGVFAVPPPPFPRPSVLLSAAAAACEMEARWFIRILTVSVLPAPDSPDTRMDWFAPCARIAV